MIFFRFYLLTELVLRKVVWTVMKRRGQAGIATTGKTRPPHIRLARLVELVLLLLITVQVSLADVLPLLGEPLAPHIAGEILYTLGLSYLE